MNDNQRPEGGPLHGITVVEIATFISGPFATLMLAQLGATVVKVEPAKGDPFRRFGKPKGEMSAMFASANRGKSSVVLDLATEDGHAALLERLETADVLLANWRPSVAQKLGLSDDLLAQKNPRLIRAYITGFGSSGPVADQPAFDAIIQARSAMMHIQSETEVPTPATTYVADKLSAVMACQAVLAAIVSRERTGLGDRVDVSMLDAVAYFNFPDALANRTFLEDAPVDPRNTLAASVRPLRTSDGWMVVIPVLGEHLKRCCAAVGHPEWIDQLREVKDPSAMVSEFFDRMESVMQIDSTEHWLKQFVVHDVPASACNSIDEHLRDPQVVHNQLYWIGETPGVGATRRIRYPAVFGSHGLVGISGDPPRIGEHTMAQGR
jgi:CoA:oxalate CoA-transferase